MDRNEAKTDLPSYLWGFLFCILLTMTAYILVDRHLLTGSTLIYTVLALGAIQTVIQLLLFLHLGQEKSPRWNLLTFFFMLTVLVVIVGGSLWIMYSLDYTVMPQMEMKS